MDSPIACRRLTGFCVLCAIGFLFPMTSRSVVADDPEARAKLAMLNRGTVQ